MKECRSRKSYKKAVHLKQVSSDGQLVSPGGLVRRIEGVVDIFKKAFGNSKHRKARVQRFNARQRSK